MLYVLNVLTSACESARRFYRNPIACGCSCALLLALVCGVPLSSRAAGQASVLTSHNGNTRSGANTQEVRLSPSNVNFNQFGVLFTQPVDGVIVGQPLYLPGVSIPGQGVHNVVFVATLHDSVYAFDADSNQGTNSAPLWQVNFTNPAAGVTTVPGSVQGCNGVTQFPELGIVSTPVIDPASGTIYVVAKTEENGSFVHRLHALDVATGTEKFNGPVVIKASYTAHNGVVVTFQDWGQMNRPGLLLANGNVYIPFGSNGCNSTSHGWVIGYNPGTLEQTGVFTTSPNQSLAGIWQSGVGPAADSAGNIYASTSEAPFDANIGGQDLGMSVFKITQGAGTLSLSDYFTPYNYAYLNANDLDLSSAGPIVLPDQPGTYPHLLIVSGKNGDVYVLNRDNMGQFNSSGNPQIVQFLPQAVGFLTGAPLYWNNTVYFTGVGNPIRAYTLKNGLLSPSTTIPLSAKIPAGKTPSLSANGNTAGIIWIINGNTLSAYDAITMKQLYNSLQAGTRDVLPTVAHFAGETVVNGRVYVGTRTGVSVYGLRPAVTSSGGAGQSGTAATTLPNPVQVTLADPYSGHVYPGVTVTFSDGGKGGSFSNPTVVTDANGRASTLYTLPKIANKYTISASAPGFATASIIEVATAGPATTLRRGPGNNQSTPILTTFPLALGVKAVDAYGNGVAGVTVTYNDKTLGGTFSPVTVVTDSTGSAGSFYKCSSKAGSIIVYATSPGLNAMNWSETVTPGPAVAISVVSGNNQTGTGSTALAQPLVVKVVDSYGNAVPNVSVTFGDGGAGGSFSADPVLTGTTGTASVTYTAGPNPGTVKITATAAGVSTPASFTETVQ